ncbi:thioesterase domain-containing protein, partial [Saccharopolyspora kobensis]
RAEPPRPGVEQRIAELWAEVLGGRLPSRDQGFFDAGGNSLLAAQFVGQVRERIPEAAPVTFDVLLRALLDTQTVAGLGKWLESEATPAPESLAGPTSALVQLGGSGQGPVRLLVHGGTGTLAEQQALIGELAAGPPLFGLVLPAPDSAAPVGLEELAAGYAREVLAAGFDEVEIIGYCLGGPIALELARALSEANAVVRGLTIVSGHRIPHLLQDELVVDYAFARTMGADPAALGWPADEAAVGRAVAAALTGSPDALAPGAIAALAGELEPVARRFRELGQQDTAERRAELHRALADSAPGKGGSARIALMHKAFTRFIEAAAHYRPEPYAGDVTFLRPVEPAHLVPGPQEDTALFWREVCLGDVTVVDIPGDHFSCLHPQHAPRVAEAIATSALERR